MKELLKLIKFLAPVFIIGLIILSPSCVNVGKFSSVQEFNCMSPGAKIEHIPGTPGILIAPTNCQDYTYIKEKVSSALFIFVEEYSRNFEVSQKHVWSMLAGLKIEVSIHGRKVDAAYDVSGNLLKDVDVTGLAISKKHIWVEINTKQINTSALVHELIHTMIWNEQGVHADPDHEGKNYSGWTKKHTRLMKDINVLLMDSGI